MNIGYLDVPASEIAKYQAAAVKKVNICRVPPAARFDITERGEVYFSTLVCRDMGGDNTGTGAQWCENCRVKTERGCWECPTRRTCSKLNLFGSTKPTCEG